MKKSTNILYCLFALVVFSFVSCGKEDPDARFKKALTKSVSNIMEVNTKSSKKMYADFNNGGTATFAVEFGDSFDVYKGIIAESLGTDLDWLKQIQFVCDYGKNGSDLLAAIDLGLNNKSLLDFSVISSSDKTYIQLPSLMKDSFYVEGNLYTLFDSVQDGLGDMYRKIFEENESLVKAEDLEKFMNGAIQSIVNPVSGVVETTETVSAGYGDINVENSYSKLTVTFDEALAENITKSFADFLEGNKFIADWLNSMEITKSYSASSVNSEIISAFEEAMDYLAEYDAVLSIYLDKKDNMTGFVFELPDEITLSSVVVLKGSDFASEAKLMEYDTILSSINGAGKIKGGKFTGDFNLNVPMEYGKDIDFEVNVKDLSLVDLAKSNLNGTISFKVPEVFAKSFASELGSAGVALVKNMTFEINSKSSGSNIDGNLKVLLSGAEMLTLKTKCAPKKVTIVIPENATNVEDIELDTIINGFDYDKLADNARNCGLPEEIVGFISKNTIDEIVDLFSSYGSYDYDDYYDYNYDDYDDYYDYYGW